MSIGNSLKTCVRERSCLRSDYKEFFELTMEVLQMASLAIVKKGIERSETTVKGVFERTVKSIVRCKTLNRALVSGGQGVTS